MMNGDEAILGIQAEQILHGAHPTYFAGQAYMGAWDAYLAAPLIALFGPSAGVLRAVTLTESLLLVPLSGALAARLYGERARVPAMLLAAVPPLYVAAGELHLLGGYVETLVLGTAALLCLAEIVARWRQVYSGGPTAGSGPSTGRGPSTSTTGLWGLLGLLAGLGVWIDPLVLYYLLAGAVWSLPFAIWRLGRARREGWPTARASALGAVSASLAFAVGAWPAIQYGLRHAWSNVAIFTTHTSSLTQADPWRRPVVVDFFTHSVPMMLGERLLWQEPRWQDVLAICKLIALAIALGLLAYAALRAVQRAWSWLASKSGGRADTSTTVPERDFWWTTWTAVLPAVLFACIFLVYWRTPSTDEILTLHPIDGNGRYALPLTTVFTLLLAAGLALLIPDIERLAQHCIRRSRTTTRGRHHAAPLPSLIGALPLLVLLCAEAIPYATTDATAALQSTFLEAANLTFPTRSAQLLTYLRLHHIHDIWTSHWIGDTVMYLEDGHVRCADPVDLTLDRDPHRFLQPITALQAATRPSFLIVSDPALGEPATERALDALHVAYTGAHFGPYWIITPRSVTVEPSAILSALEQNYH
jgi:hypothetical protein